MLTMTASPSLISNFDVTGTGLKSVFHFKVGRCRVEISGKKLNNPLSDSRRPCITPQMLING
jgi:hypothetical protein